jgi:hypothetical protein
MSERRGAMRASAARVTMGFAVAGLALAAVIACRVDVGLLLWPQVWLGGLGVVLCARASARWLAARYANSGCARAALWGALQAIGCLVLGTVLGSIPGLVQGADQIRAFGIGEWLFDWLVKPLYWVLLIGSLPAILIGVSCGLVVRRRARALAGEVLAVAGRHDGAGRQNPDDRHNGKQQERD